VDIQLDYDSSVSKAPKGFTTALQYAADQLDALITNDITVSITVSWNNGLLGEGGPNLYSYDYASVAAALQAGGHDGAFTLPVQDPTEGGLYLSSAQAEALGIDTASDFSGPEGFVTFGTDNGFALDFNTQDQAISNEVDFIGVAEHELTHALGRVDFGDAAPVTIQDLYRFSAPGVPDSKAADQEYFSVNNGVTDLADYSLYSDYSDWASSATADSFDAISLEGVANTISAADETLLSAIGFDVACFTGGTRIRLAVGAEVPVEALAIGDVLRTRFRGAQRVKWIGISRYDGRFIGQNHLMLPVCIAAGALAPGVPARALTLSPGHAVCIGDVLVPAWRLMNGVSITQAEAVACVAYYHIELEAHDVIEAEGCPAESYLDEQCRHWFQNAAGYDALYPGAAVPGVPCLPRVEDGFALREIQRAVDARAGIAPAVERAGPLRGFVDVAGPALVCGWAQNAEQPEVPVTLEILDGSQVVGCVLANRYRADLRQAGLGSGCHAFEVTLAGLTRPSVRRVLDGAVLEFTEAARAA